MVYFLILIAGLLFGAPATAQNCTGPLVSGNTSTDSCNVATIQQIPSGVKTAAIVFVIDGGGSAITTGIKGDIEVPFACTITAVRTLLDQSGSIVVDIWKDTYANYPPTDADSITASAPPTVSSTTKAEDSTLTGWTTSISAGNILRYNVDSITTATRATITLSCTKSA
jgi:hypothetical protein